MARVPFGVARHQKKRKVLKKARGYYGASHRHYRSALQAILRSETNATRDRINRKRDFRRLWITRISAALSGRSLPYSRFMHGLKKAHVELNRKIISELAVRNPHAFDQLAEIARAEL